MAKVPFTLKELEDLARKLQTLQPFLSEKERALMLAVFAAVIDLAKGSDTRVGAAESTLPAAILIEAQGADRPATLADLQLQFGNAFTPGGDIGSVTIGEVMIRIIRFPPPPPPPPPPSSPPPAGEPGDGE